jgi:large subunit ribosomal protein L6
MSRIGKKPIEIPQNVKVKIEGQQVKIEGPKGELYRNVRPEIKVELQENQIMVKPRINPKQARAFWGLERALLQNMILGVTQGFEKKLEMVGVGYRAKMEGKDLILELGFTHPVRITPPSDVEISVQGKVITVSGIDKTKVGQWAAKIKKAKKPDPYKGKGIRYLGEEIKLKPGKKAATAA